MTRGALHVVLLALLLLASMRSIHASCAQPLTIQNTGNVTGPMNCIYCYDAPNFLDSGFGAFWSLGNGDPALGAGDDSGDSQASSWFVGLGPVEFNGFYLYAQSLSTSWDAGGVDNCIQPAGGPDACTVVLLNQEPPNGSDAGFFTLAAAQQDGSGNFVIPGNMQMHLMPTPILVDSFADGTNVSLTIAVSSPPTDAINQHPSCDAVANGGFRLYVRVVTPPDSPPPIGRHSASWTLLSAAVTPFSQLVEVSVPCTESDAIYLAASLVFDSGFETPYLSANSTVIDCDPTCQDDDSDGFGDPGEPACPNGATTDCNDNDPNNWTSCATCMDGDLDSHFIGCDAYVTVAGPDCNDSDPNNWDSCASCVDMDGDGFYISCDAYVTINGQDCSDVDPDNWVSCASCVDRDGDGYFAGCDLYVTRLGPDCDDDASACTVDCTSCLACDLYTDPAACVLIQPPFDTLFRTELVWFGISTDEFWRVNVEDGPGFTDAAGVGFDAAGNLYTLSPPFVRRYTPVGSREIVAVTVGDNILRGLGVDTTNGRLYLAIGLPGESIPVSIVAISGLPRVFEIFQSYEPTAKSLGFRVPYQPEGLPAADWFDTFTGTIGNYDLANSQPLQCEYPAAAPTVGDYLTVADTLPSPAPGTGRWFLTAVNYLGETRVGRKTTAGVLSGRDPASLPNCSVN